MSDYRVHALTETSHLMPDGDGYAPQVAITWGRYSTNATTLNGDMLPLDADEIASAFESFNYDPALTLRWLRIVTGYEVVALKTIGYSQGDVCISFAIATPEWLQLTGASGITPQDCQDLASWIWGDVYEVIDDEGHKPLGYGGFPGSRECECGATCCEDAESFYVYGMDAAREYGEIVFPTYTTTISYED